MNRDELIVVITLSLFVAFIMGWVFRWIYAALYKMESKNMSEINNLVDRLYKAERAKDNLVDEFKHREGELTNHISQIQAELDVTMAGLGDARREIEMLRKGSV